jgi:hypothetical protein
MTRLLRTFSQWAAHVVTVLVLVVALYERCEECDGGDDE